MTADGTPAAMLGKRRIVLCVGCGGVGKTTVAAALGLAAARLGRRAVVITIDPARRLADALGVGALGNTPREIPAQALAGAGVACGGRLSAMMLDMKRTFDDLVERFADSPQARDRIFRNRIYQHVSDALAGSAEYTAMEKVYELSERDDFDVIVVDTPPSRHAFDFLEAPQRLLDLLDNRLVKMLLHPAFAAGRFGFRLFHRSVQRVFRIIERVSGVGFLADISEFLLAFEGMSEGFRQRALRVRALLLGPEAAFVLVAGPAAESAEEGARFLDRLAATGAPLAGVVLNRVHAWPGTDASPPAIDPSDADRKALAEALVESGDDSFPAGEAARAAIAAAESYASMVSRDARATAPLIRRAKRAGVFWCRVPEFRQDVHDLSALARIGSFIVGECAEEQPIGEPAEGARNRSDR